MRLVLNNFSEHGGGDDFLQRHEGAIPASALENRKHLILLFRKRNKFLRIFHRIGERFFHDHMLPGFHGLDREIKMSIVRCIDNDQFYFGIVENVLKTSHDCDLGIILFGLIRFSLQNGFHAKTRMDIQQGGMKYFPRHAVG